MLICLQMRIGFVKNILTKIFQQREIALLIPCSKLTVTRAIRKFGITVKPKHITYGDIVYPDRKGENSPTWKGGKHHFELQY